MVWLAVILVLVLLAWAAYKYFLPDLGVTEVLKMEGKELLKEAKSAVNKKEKKEGKRKK